MKPIASRLFVSALLIALLLSCSLQAYAVSAPQFTVTTLAGQTFTSSSLTGSVVLLQFWTTWCPVCHQDQAAVDAIQSEFGGSGLVVIAVDDGEPEALVRKYLQVSPRSVPIVVNQGRSLAASFGVHSYPHYVVIDRNGSVVASRSGGGGQPYLRALLRTAGLGSKPDSLQANVRTAPANVASPQLVNVPPTQSIVATKPIPKTIFVFTNGDRLEADHYVVNATFLHVTAEGQERSIPISALDIRKTIAVNRERGINIKIPTNGNELLLAF